jgi:hypothetical protein
MSDMLELAKRIAERAGKNAKVAPELLYAPILWELQDDARSSAVSAQPMASDWPDNSYVYRFEYADGSAFEVLEDGRAFIVYKDGRREEKRGKIDSRIRLLVGRAVKPLHDLLRANGITGAPVRARAALPTREEVIGECLSAMPSTAEDPNESSYQRGRFDGVMEYQREIRKLSGTEPQTAMTDAEVDVYCILRDMWQEDECPSWPQVSDAIEWLIVSKRCQAVCVDTDLLEALRSVQKLISEAAMTGFNCHDGDWAERLFHSQQATSAAIKKAALTRPQRPQD